MSTLLLRPDPWPYRDRYIHNCLPKTVSKPEYHQKFYWETWPPPARIKSLDKKNAKLCLTGDNDDPMHELCQRGAVWHRHRLPPDPRLERQASGCPHTGWTGGAE